MADLRCEVLIIGGGVVGLALARALSLRGRDVALVELQSRCGMATSSRHSEVIHAGIYYPTGSLKAETCIEGRRALYGYLDSHAIQYQKISKLIFASQPSEVATLEALYRQGIRNGVEGLSIVGGAELRDLEPELKAERAILSKRPVFSTAMPIYEHLKQMRERLVHTSPWVPALKARCVTMLNGTCL